MRSRYYCPERRRFLNPDVLHGNITDSTSLNRYAYVNGNPVSLVDPLGLSAERGGNTFVSQILNTFVSAGKSTWEFLKNAIELEFGTGFGFAGQLDYNGVGIDINTIVDMPRIILSDRGYEEYIQSDFSITVDLLAYEFGPHYIDYDGEKPVEFSWFKEKKSISLFNVGGYLFYGVNFSVNLDHNYIIDEVVKLFEKK